MIRVRRFIKQIPAYLVAQIPRIKIVDPKVDPSVKTLREAVLRATLLLFFLKTHGFNAGIAPVSENTLQLGFGTPVLDEAVYDCKIRNSSAIGSVPLSVRYTHADRLLHI